ncbi:uncharacterized protein LOC141857506 [Brevipalpus obovatus]|uniref:uncharacterized protein LOC141857506 n=1 Tax=Brevipalpus obovatus TaxID=246614 RepID=UPI003D9F80D7
MDFCCGCRRSWETVRKNDKVKGKYTITDDEMARFFTERSGYGCMPGWLVCKKCQNAYNTERTRRRREEAQNPDRPRLIIEEVFEPVAGPSGMRAQASLGEIEASASSMAISPDPSISSPLSFTPSPRRPQAFQFPPVTMDEPQNPGESDSSPDSDDEPQDDPDFELREYEETAGETDFDVTISAHTSCIYGCRQPSSLTNVPVKLRIEMLVIYRAFIPQGASLCHSHLKEPPQEPVLSEEEMDILRYKEALELVIRRRDMIGKITIPDSGERNSRIIKQLTTLTSAHFDDLLHYISGVRQPRQSLGAYLFRLRTGLSLREVSMLFEIPKSTLFCRFKKISHQLYSKFCPLNLGFDHLENRDKTFEHHTEISNRLFLSERQKEIKSKITIWDGTYIYMQKSMNVKVQKKSFSGQKKVPLFKPMMCVFPNGYIYEIFPFNTAVANDATIFRRIANSDPRFARYFKTGDAFIFDRGFRDVVREFTSKGFNVYVPASAAGRDQFSWSEANTNRMITELRWVVEAVNGRLKKQFRALHHIVENTNIKSKLFELKICCAIINKYGERSISDKNHTDEIVHRIQSRREIEQKLKQFIIGNGLEKKRVDFRTLDPLRERLIDPPFTMHELYLIATGSYLVKYIDAYVDACREANLENSLQVYRKNCERMLERHGIEANMPRLVRMRVPSRHRSQTNYPLFIVIDTAASGLDQFVAFCCKCLTDLRTINPCAHIIAVLHVLGSGFTCRTPAAGLLSVLTDHELHDESDRE